MTVPRPRRTVVGAAARGELLRMPKTSRREVLSKVTEGKVLAFEAWLRAGGTEFAGVQVRIRPGHPGVGVFANKSFRPGEVVFSVPRKLCIEVPLPTPQAPRAVLARAATAWAPEFACGPLASPPPAAALLALAERLLRERSAAAAPHAEHMALLAGPSQLHPLHCPWPAELLAASPLLSGLYRALEAQSSSCLQLLAEEPDWERRCWALSIAWSLAMELDTKEESEVLALVPLADLLSPWSPRHSDDSLWTCVIEERGDAVAAVADRPISRGEELTRLLANQSDGLLLCRHGQAAKAPALNTANEAAVSVPPEVVCQAPTRQAGGATPELISARAAVLERHGWLDLRQPLLFAVPRELRPRGGLRALSRLLALRTPEEVADWEHRIFWMDAPDSRRLQPEELGAGRERNAWRLVSGWLAGELPRRSESAEVFLDGLQKWKDLPELANAVASVVVGEVTALEECQGFAARRAAKRRWADAVGPVAAREPREPGRPRPVVLGGPPPLRIQASRPHRR